MNLNTALNISSSGMTAERFRLDVISSNIANADTVQIGSQSPYRRREVELTGGPNGVQVTGVVPDMTPFPQTYDPGSKLANAQGNVVHSNVQPITEMVDMITASRAYEANVAAFNTAKGMIESALNIGKV